MIVPAGAFRIRPCPETRIERDDGTGNIRALEDLFMDGAEIFNFSLQTVPKSVNQLMKNIGITMDEVDYVAFHQANQFMLEALRRKIKIPKEKFGLILETHGNTSSASIPMAIEVALEEGKIHQGARILVAGFGVGYSWSTAMIKLVL